MENKRILKFLSTDKNSNNCAYYYDENTKELVLIGSSQTLFLDLLKKFNDISKLSLILTHLNNKDGNNLLSFISYSNTTYNLKPEIIFPRKDLKIVLDKMNISKDWYVYQNHKKHNLVEKAVKSFDESYSYILNIGNLKIYYSVNSILLPKNVLYKFICHDINAIYYDMTRSNNRPRISMDYFLKIIPKKLRKNFYAMYIEDLSTEIYAKLHGFSIVK